jgi:hypothetical protein
VREVDSKAKRSVMGVGSLYSPYGCREPVQSVRSSEARYWAEMLNTIPISVRAPVQYLG